jgi:adenosylcobinamide-GDP ribazoletransferase
VRRALAFLTPLPVGGAGEPQPSALAWFPVVGALVGFGVGGVWWAADRWWPPLVAAALTVIADLALTGMLHVDGLVDTADGLLPPLGDRDRRLEVMADPNAGAFGTAAAIAVLGTRAAVFASHRPDAVAVAGMWMMSRTVMASTARHVTYVRPGGLATSFVGGRGNDVALALGAAAAVALAGWSAVAVAMAGAAVVAVAVRRLGGFTGDVLGGAGVVGETAGLVVLAATW